jgi:hypothetical protein
MVKPVVPWIGPTGHWHGIPVVPWIGPTGHWYGIPVPETRMRYRYDKKFALFPIKCEGGYWVWFNHYYKKYLVFSYEEIRDVCYYLCKLTTADAVVEKLTDSIDFR